MWKEKNNMLNFVLLVVGFVMLVKGADWFVEGAASLAARFGIPQLVIGLTIVRWEPVCRRLQSVSLLP